MYEEVSWGSRGHISGQIPHFWPVPGELSIASSKFKKIQKITKIEIFMKKLIFFLMFKIDFRDRKWPENGLKGVLKWFKSPNWQLNPFSANFEKIPQKIWEWLLAFQWMHHDMVVIWSSEWLVTWVLLLHDDIVDVVAITSWSNNISTVGDFHNC